MSSWNPVLDDQAAPGEDAAAEPAVGVVAPLEEEPGQVALLGGDPDVSDVRRPRALGLLVTAAWASRVAARRSAIEP